ncbi:MAG: septation protein SepH [Corynebacterium sp.]|uniref:septation protein SepH n=1 Tax=Corynebacterium sp. TaxID=1720 RepID=UPI0026DC2FF6|nr:septation protein SepH [Corynebacterium sp.]MDO4761993.1 septation protein SepH [Corynebacterium sp.]
MKELFLVEAESTPTSLVFVDPESEQQYFLVVTDTLRDAFAQHSANTAAQAHALDSSSDVSSIAPRDNSARGDLHGPSLVVSAPENADEQVHAPIEGGVDTPVQQATKPEASASFEAAAQSAEESSGESPVSYSPSPEASTASTEAVASADSASATSSVASAPTPAESHADKREIDPRLSAPLKMRPREIQERIRAGATVAELAELNNVTEARIEPYAHPVLLERTRMAEMAKRAFPVRDDGPAKLSLWEILATAFAARGLDLLTSEWDAYRDAANQWVIQVKWDAGVTQNVAEWSYLKHSASNATAVARNSLAADLIDPDFIKPVRSLTAVHSPSPAPSIEDTQDIPVIDEPADVAEATGEDFQQRSRPEHDAQQRANRRRRKAVTPHWEDVLLGVRTNTKRPRK